MKFEYAAKQIDIVGFDANDHISRQIESSKTFYEEDLLDYIRYVLRGQKGVVIDVGANIGNHSIFFAKFVSEKLVSVEPNPDVLPILKRNLEVNGVHSLVFECGLGEKSECAFIEVPAAHSNNIGAARLVLVADEPKAAIAVRRLDDLIPEIATRYSNEKVMALKADVEGMESAVLRGSIQLLIKDKPHLFLEAATMPMLQELEEILTPLGYRKMGHFAATPVWHFVHTDNFVWVYIAGLLNTVRRPFLHILRKVKKGFST